MRSWLKFAVLALVAIAVSQWYVYRSKPRQPGGTAAPAFTLSDTNGRSVSLSALKGKVVAVNFWATWCPPCRAEIPELSRVYSENRGKCFELLGVAEESGPRDVVVEAAQRFGASYPILLDEEGKAADAFRVGGYPNTFLIDASGNIRKVFAGGIDGAELRDALDPLLKEAPKSCPRA